MRHPSVARAGDAVVRGARRAGRAPRETRVSARNGGTLISD